MPLSKHGAVVFDRRSGHPVLFASSLVLAPLLWVAFVGSTHPHELLVGAAAAIATVAFTTFVCRSSETRLTFRIRDVRQIWRIPANVLKDLVTTLCVLFDDLTGKHRADNLYRVCGFDASAHDPVRVARAMLTVVYTSAAPNAIVVGIDATQSRMLFHQLKRTPIDPMTRNLGAKP